MTNIYANINVDAEESLVACLLYDKDIQSEYLTQVTEDLFGDKTMREACVLMKRLASDGLQIDSATIYAVGSEDFQLNFAGRISAKKSEIGYINEHVFKGYLSIVKRDAQVRKLQGLLANAADHLEASNFSSEEEVVSIASDILDKMVGDKQFLGVVKGPKELANNLFDRVSKAKEDFNKGIALTSIPTGFKAFDDITGGLKPAQMIVIAAQTGVGKTSFALNVAESISFREDKRKVLFFSLEMTEEQLINRIACVHMQVDTRTLDTPHLIPEAKLAKLGETAGKFNDSMFFLYDDGSSDANYILSIIRRTVQKEKIDVIIIDYLQLIEGNRGKSDNRVYELSKITRALKNITRELRIPVIVLSQLNRDIEKRTNKVPQLSDLRDSGSIEQDADIVMFISRNFADEAEMREPDLKINEAKFYIRKFRAGPKCSFKLGFIEQYTRFENITN